MAGGRSYAAVLGQWRLSAALSRLLFYVGLLLFTTHTVASSPTSQQGSDKRLLPYCGSRKCIGFDVVIYGSTPAAIAAAVQTVRMNKTVAIVTPDKFLGGLTSSGLGWTDSKNGDSIGGIAREFYKKVYKHYTYDSAWTQETRQQYLAKHIDAQPGPAIDEGKRVQWTFEPHVAEKIFEKWMKDADVPIFRNEPINRSSLGVVMAGSEILLINTLGGRYLVASMFIDASYEGDLMATAGVSYSVGRESVDQYGESFAGQRLGDVGYGNIDPYVSPGDPSSGLLPGITRELRTNEIIKGLSDPNRLQSFNYRIPLTKSADNKIPFSQPDGYDEDDYELLFRYIESGAGKGPFFTEQLMPNKKTDTNANGLVSTDLMGGNYDKRSNYADDSYQQRAKIAQRHKTYAQGFFWTLANHPRIPQSIRNKVSAFGYAADEFNDNGNFPYSIYLRESRRMDGVYKVTQDDIQNPKAFDDDSVVGLGCYNLDVHAVERVVKNGRIYNEGFVHEWNLIPYPIPYESIIPQARDATNLLNPVTMSSTHIAFASIRMEPTYMILGQSAATAAVLAIEQGVGVQDVDRDELTARLRSDHQILEF